MGWNVSYTTLNGRVSFQCDNDINHCHFKPEGKSADEAIEYVKDYIIEIYGENALSAKISGEEIIVTDFPDEVIETYKDFSAEREYVLIGADGIPYLSNIPGQLGGHKQLKIYGRLDCPSAARYIAKGQYVKHRVFFKDEETAIAAGYRPCSRCMPEEYRKWKASHMNTI